MAPVREEKVLSGARKPTPMGLPVLSTPDRGSHDDVERVLETERLERERALLLTKLQDTQQALEESERQVEQLKRPPQAFPPPSIRPSPKTPEPRPSLQEVKLAQDIKGLEKAIVGSRLGRGAIAAGVLLALAWNAFNSVRQLSPEQKVAAVQERLQQNERLSGAELQAQALERDRNLRRMRAIECWARQLRGASQRQGLDLPSLPAGGVTVSKLGEDEPERSNAKRLVVVEKCPDFPPLPPDTAAQ